MAEISMVQMTGPAVSPGASAKEVQGSLASDFSELLRDKGQSVSDGGKKTSDDMDAWISADARRIPVRLEGKLPVGKVHCVYTGQ